MKINKPFMTRNIMNPFSSLSIDYDDDAETKNLTRKAQKKLREIDILKRKKIKTHEEFEKIQQEEYWRDIAEPPEHFMNTLEERVRKSKEKEETRKMHQLREKHKEEISKKNKTISIKEKIIDKKDKLIDEMNTRFCILFEENARLRKQIEDMKNISLDEKLKNEFLECYANIKSYKKAYHVMMRKYHPDKKKNGMSSKMAEECSKILNNLKNEYVRD